MTNNPNDAPGLGGGGALPGPGSTLDRLICKKLGYEWVERTGIFGTVGMWVDATTGDDIYFHGWSPEPAYSADMNAAWLLVEQVINKQPKFYFEVGRRTNGVWLASFELEVSFDSDSNPEYYAVADTAPHAIALAFLALPDEVVREGGEK